MKGVRALYAPVLFYFKSCVPPYFLPLCFYEYGLLLFCFHLKSWSFRFLLQPQASQSSIPDHPNQNLGVRWREEGRQGGCLPSKYRSPSKIQKSLHNLYTINPDHCVISYQASEKIKRAQTYQLQTWFLFLLLLLSAGVIKFSRLSSTVKWGTWFLPCVMNRLGGHEPVKLYSKSFMFICGFFLGKRLTAFSVFFQQSVP